MHRSSRVFRSKALCRRTVAIAMVTTLSACTHVTRPPDPAYNIDYEALYPAAVNEANGGIYHQSVAVSLFADAKARRVGDVLTILLRERTDAQKESATDLSKEAEVSAEASGGGFFGIFGGSASANKEFGFGGRGSADQRNRLTGDIAVVVVQVLQNGLLVVRGEKVVGINQGEEYVRLTGLVRPVDIERDNTVFSTKVADARITYSGRGATADSNVPGLFSRFFVSGPLF